MSKASPSKVKFYAVRTGARPGIYTTWDECKTQVSGYPGAEFKSFALLEHARSFLGLDPLESTGPSPQEVNGVDRAEKEDVLIVYTDGSSLSNGRASARGGVGVYFGPDDPRNLSEPLKGKVTNNRAELTAAIRALEMTIHEARPIVIHTDSKYLLNSVTQWIAVWKRNGWRGSTGSPVENRDLMVRLDRLLEQRSSPIHVKAHKGHHGNEEADRLANDGAEMVKLSSMG